MLNKEKLGELEMIKEEFKKASKRFKEMGPLGVLAEDWHKIGGTPPPELEANPGKTMLDLMSEQQVLDWLNGTKKEIEQAQGFYSQAKDSRQKHICKVQIQSDIEALGATLKLLKELNRLPKEFENYQILEPKFDE